MSCLNQRVTSNYYHRRFGLGILYFWVILPSQVTINCHKIIAGIFLISYILFQSQFSDVKLFTLLNSLTLLVTRTKLLARLIDAIKRSMGPIGIPDFSNEALIFGYILVHFSSKGIISKVDTNFSIINCQSVR
jgi:hypothetical protein